MATSIDIVNTLIQQREASKQADADRIMKGFDAFNENRQRAVTNRLNQQQQDLAERKEIADAPARRRKFRDDIGKSQLQNIKLFEEDLITEDELIRRNNADEQLLIGTNFSQRMQGDFDDEPQGQSKGLLPDKKNPNTDPDSLVASGQDTQQSAQIPQVQSSLQPDKFLQVNSQPQVVQSPQKFDTSNMSIVERRAFKKQQKAQEELAVKQAEADIQVQKEVDSQRFKQLDKALVGAEEGSQGFEAFGQELQLSAAELVDKFGVEVFDPTIHGAFLRTSGKVLQKFGVLPETEAFRDQIGAYATPLAKSAGEDRLTKEDIERFTAILPDILGTSSQANINKMRSLLIRWRDVQGADISTIRKTFTEAGGVLAQVIEKVDSFKGDAKAAGKLLDEAYGVSKGISESDINDLAKEFF